MISDGALFAPAALQGEQRHDGVLDAAARHSDVTKFCQEPSAMSRPICSRAAFLRLQDVATASVSFLGASRVM